MPVYKRKPKTAAAVLARHGGEVYKSKKDYSRLSPRIRKKMIMRERRAEEKKEQELLFENHDPEPYVRPYFEPNKSCPEPVTLTLPRSRDPIHYSTKMNAIATIIREKKKKNSAVVFDIDGTIMDRDSWWASKIAIWQNAGEFIKKVSRDNDIYLYTAASESHAQRVAEKIAKDLGIQVCFAFHSGHCYINKKYSRPFADEYGHLTIFDDSPSVWGKHGRAYVKTVPSQDVGEFYFRLLG